VVISSAATITPPPATSLITARYLYWPKRLTVSTSQGTAKTCGATVAPSATIIDRTTRTEFVTLASSGQFLFGISGGHRAYICSATAQTIVYGLEFSPTARLTLRITGNV
jgi:hypothetical protein